jgi:hypothetical protein
MHIDHLPGLVGYTSQFFAMHFEKSSFFDIPGQEDGEQIG